VTLHGLANNAKPTCAAPPQGRTTYGLTRGHVGDTRTQSRPQSPGQLEQPTTHRSRCGPETADVGGTEREQSSYPLFGAVPEHRDKVPGWLRYSEFGLGRH